MKDTQFPIVDHVIINAHFWLNCIVLFSLILFFVNPIMLHTSEYHLQEVFVLDVDAPSAFLIPLLEFFGVPLHLDAIYDKLLQRHLPAATGIAPLHQELHEVRGKVDIHVLQRTGELLFSQKPTAFPVAGVERVDPLFDAQIQLLEFLHVQAAVSVQVEETHHEFAGAVGEVLALEGLEGQLQLLGGHFSIVSGEHCFEEFLGLGLDHGGDFYGFEVVLGGAVVEMVPEVAFCGVLFWK